MLYRGWLIGVVLACLGACGSGDNKTAMSVENTQAEDTAASQGPDHVDTERLSEIVRVLASDDFEGRAPGTAGGRKTVEFLSKQFARLGLEPGGRDGSWTQKVPLIRTQVQSPGGAPFHCRRHDTDARAAERRRSQYGAECSVDRHQCPRCVRWIRCLCAGTGLG